MVNVAPGWHFWAVVRDGANLNFYCDGVLREIISGFSATVLGDGQLQAGKSSRWGHFSEYFLDETAIYRRALSAEEIVDEFENGVGSSARISANKLSARNVEDAILELKNRVAEFTNFFGADEITNLKAEISDLKTRLESLENSAGE